MQRLGLWLIALCLPLVGCGIEIRFPDPDRPDVRPDDRDERDDRRPAPRGLAESVERELGGNREAAAFYAAYYELLLRNIGAGRYATLIDLAKVTAEVPHIAGYPTLKESAGAADDGLEVPAPNAPIKPGEAGHAYAIETITRLRDACKEAAR